MRKRSLEPETGELLTDDASIRHSNDAAFDGKVHFVKFDVEEIPEISQELNIRAMPTFLVFKDGERSDELVGANPGALLQLIKKHAE